MLRFKIRYLTGLAVTPILWMTGYRFSKRFRWESTRFHAIVYRWVDTVGANLRAGL